MMKLALALLLASVAFVTTSPAYAQATSGFEQRRLAAMAQFTQRAAPAKADCNDDDLRGNCGVLRPLSFAISSLFRDSDSDEGNAVIADSVAAVGRVVRSPKWRATEKKATIGAAIPLQMLVRTYFLFGPKGTKAPGRLSESNQSGIREAVWEYAKGRCSLESAGIDKVWIVKGSENIHLLDVTLCWEAAELLSGVPPRRYDDASSTEQQKAAWNKYLKEYISQRAKYGGLTEFFSSYYKYSLIGIFNVADFASDSRLRELASSFLDVWYADWAEEQIDGLHGGSKARIYSEIVEPGLVAMEPAWFYFGIGVMPVGIGHPSQVFMLTSTYHPPEIVGEIATKKVTTPYIVKSRRPGLEVAGSGELMDAKAGGILRYAFVSPSFVMGTSMLARRPLKDWSPASSQNRWNGVVLRGSGKRYLYVRPVNTSRSVYNSEWGVQAAGTQLIQKLAPPFGSKSGPLTIWYGSDLKPEQAGDWYFFDSSAYVAVRAVFGRLEIRRDARTGLTVTDELSPVIVTATEKEAFASFDDFKAKTLRARLSRDSDTVQFSPPQNGSVIKFFYRSGRLPEIDGKAIDIAPSFGFESPYMKSIWGQGVITITFGDKHIVRDFAN